MEKVKYTPNMYGKHKQNAYSKNACQIVKFVPDSRIGTQQDSLTKQKYDSSLVCSVLCDRKAVDGEREENLPAAICLWIVA